MNPNRQIAAVTTHRIQTWQSNSLASAAKNVKIIILDLSLE